MPLPRAVRYRNKGTQSGTGKEKPFSGTRTEMPECRWHLSRCRCPLSTYGQKHLLPRPPPPPPRYLNEKRFIIFQKLSTLNLEYICRFQVLSFPEINYRPLPPPPRPLLSAQRRQVEIISTSKISPYSPLR
jgi:hypothetical protein